MTRFLFRRAAARLARRGWLRLARVVAWFAGPATNRAHLLLDPGPGDDCSEFVSEPSFPDCDTDGHYLCAECGHRRHPDPTEDS